MVAESQGEVQIRVESDIVVVRKTVREAAKALGFGLTDLTRIVTAASELARNVVSYAGAGVMEWNFISKPGSSQGIELRFVDHGPGIANLSRVMEGGFTTSGGLGMGVSGSKRLMDEMEVDSEVGRGTAITVRKWRRL